MKLRIDKLFGKNIKYMDFPKSELESYRKRLSKGLPTYTTRISAEQGKYIANEIVNSPFGRIKINQVTSYKAGSKHPFEKELSPGQLASIKGPFDIIRFSLVNVFIKHGPAKWLKLAQFNFDSTVWKIKDQHKLDLKKVILVISDVPVDKDGKKSYDHINDSLGSAASKAVPPFIVIPSEAKFIKVMKHWNIPKEDKDDMLQHIITHELIHFVVDTYSDDRIKREVKALGNFGTVYSKAVKKDTETLVEYLSLKLIGKI
jgi:hypothetical protein